MKTAILLLLICVNVVLGTNPINWVSSVNLIAVIYATYVVFKINRTKQPHNLNIRKGIQ